MADDGRKYQKVEKEDPPVDDPENPEWTEEDFAKARPASDFPELRFLLKGGRPRLPAECKKRRVTIMLDPDVIAHFKAGGRGWQTRLNAALRKAAGLAG